MLVPLSSFAEPSITLSDIQTHSLVLQQKVAFFETQAPHIERDVLQQLQNTPLSAIETIIKEPLEARLTSFPIETPLMSSGKVASRAINLPLLSHPVFIIGSDHSSKRWLKQHGEQLKRCKAIGFLVQANSQAEFEEMKSIANELTLIPLSGNAMAQQWQLTHYPILISRNAIEQ